MTGKPGEIVIVGAGGMGSLFGSILQDGGLSVTLVDIDAALVAAIQRDGLAITGYGGERTVAMTATTNAADIASADLVLIQCKAYGTRAAARSVRHLVDGGAVCVSFQNGLGNEEIIAEEVGADNVLGGLTAMASTMLTPGKIRDFSRVSSYIGEMQGGVSDRAVAIASALSGAGLETHASDNVRRDIWKKLLGNIAMSAVSGVTNMTSVECLNVPALKETSLRALDEALAVARAQGIDLDRATAVDGLNAITAPGGTGDNKSSLCEDIQHQRPTEVDVIYGRAIELGAAAGLETPTLRTLASIVKGLESRYLEDKR